MGLIHFRGGPLDGYTYESSSLLGSEALALPVIEYNWTSEKIKSKTSEAQAQVWVHKDGTNAAAVPTGTQTVPSAVPAPDPTPKPEPKPKAEPKPTPAPAEESEGFVGATNAPPAPEPVPAPTPGPDDAPDNDLEDRRKKLKLSRKDVSEATGLAQSKVWGIETGKGKRVKPEERQVLAKYLQSQEQASASV